MDKTLSIFKAHFGAAQLVLKQGIEKHTCDEILIAETQKDLLIDLYQEITGVDEFTAIDLLWGVEE